MKKKVIITGGAQGIGKVISLRLIKEGYNVVVFEIDEEAIHEFQTQHPSSGIEFYTCDVSNELEVKNAIRQVTLQSESLYALINNAAILNNKPFETLTVEEWNRVLNVNLTGSFICAKYAVTYLKKGKGVIINLCSTRAFQSEAHTEAYSASKGGVFSLTHALAVSLGPEVRVNCISPGWIDVSAVRKESEAKQYQITEDDCNQHPVGRVGKAHDIANMVIYLLNPENSFITGQNFIIDGGMSKKMIYV